MKSQDRDRGRESDREREREREDNERDRDKVKDRGHRSRDKEKDLFSISTHLQSLYIFCITVVKKLNLSFDIFSLAAGHGEKSKHHSSRSKYINYFIFFLGTIVAKIDLF